MYGHLNVKFETCVRLCLIFYIYIFVLLLKHNGDVSPENWKLPEDDTIVSKHVEVW